MQQDELLPPYLSASIVYIDDDLIELEARAIQGGWSGTVCAYTSLQILKEEASSLRDWSRHLEGIFALHAGTECGWLRLRFYCIDLAGHLCCHVEMGRRNHDFPARKEEHWHLSFEMPTEPGLLDRFADELSSLSPAIGAHAVLTGVDWGRT